MRLVQKHTEVGYLTPGQRDGCRNCSFSESYRPESGVVYASPRLQCMKHYIEVTSGAICDTFRSTGTPPASPAEQAFRAAQRSFPDLGNSL